MISTALFIKLVNSIKHIKIRKITKTPLYSGPQREELNSSGLDFFNQSEFLLAVGKIDDCRLIDVSLQWTVNFGMQREDLVSKPFLDFVHPDDRDKTAAQFKSLYQSQKIDKETLRFLTISGDFKWLGYSVTYNPTEKRFYFIGKDITEQHEQKDFAETFFDRAVIGLNLCTMEGDWLQSNPAFLKMIGYTKDESDGKLTYWQLTPRKYDLQ